MNRYDGVTVLSIMGNDYSVKAPPGEEQTLQQAAAMLQASLTETKRQYPTLIGDRLLMLAALNLCSKQIQLEKQHKIELERAQEQVDATVQAISRTIGQG
ncbi:cell division protein ZapA [Pseudomonas sp. DTU_2021_1001937_2_SI_NGA_ILE_001]|uniref:cell division protein ZapA n=1 Tax=Pseudomonas sp. DTU_2021_1001937_2_SI_NGA_ILE_001 TaxID=3077589 RepID=UPI0025FD22FE|nr:cell division protein ZapA [Pseudomonas sp. DTU_2021_1001937_2_SI_NGA_ILE_001]WNW12229.1 cell division protein ZapA [Pseudomonas sp. DTU_2021_1001937_2_SI_NGA_ILE_001]